MLLHPVKKNNKYVSTTQHIVKHFLSDVKIKSIHKFVDNKGYLITIYIPNTVNEDVINNLCDFDDQVIDNIKSESINWFSKSFTDDELNHLYTRSYCKQTHTINIILSSTCNTKIILNNKRIDTFEDITDLIRDVKHLKKCVLNVEIQHIGLYFYKETANNKWIIRSLDITDTTQDVCSFSKDDIEDKLDDNINALNIKTENKIKDCEGHIAEISNNMTNIKGMFKQLQNSFGRNWEELLNQINSLIVIQEDKMKNF